LVGDIAISRRSERAQILRDNVARSSGWHTHVGEEIVDVVRQERAKKVSLRLGGKHVGQPGAYALDLGLHFIDGGKPLLPAERLGQPVRRDFGGELAGGR
jgi:hypothetical protein